MPARELSTDRLRLGPLTIDHARRVVDGNRQPEWAAGYPTDGDREICALLVAAYDAGGVADDELCHRVVVDAATGTVIGGIGFVGPPTDAGEIAVGYGLAEEWRGRGLATEALRAIVRLASSDDRVRAVIADTTTDNVASVRVLEKSGFEQVGRDGDHVYFRTLAV